MKTSKTLFLALILGSILNIYGYSLPNFGRGFSAPETLQPESAEKDKDSPEEDKPVSAAP